MVTTSNVETDICTDTSVGLFVTPPMVRAMFINNRGNQIIAMRKKTRRPPTEYLTNFDLATALGPG